MGKYGYNHGDFGWNELAVDNTQKAIEFYSQLLAWQVEEMDMPDGKYHVLINGEEKVGGIVAKDAEQAAGPSAWLPYITVDNVDEATAKAFDLGGKVIAPPIDIPVENGPRFAMIEDPSGAKLGLITYVAQNAEAAV
ncbi:MAG: VOC family protein [Verrucomicrobiota bacterium]